VTPRKLPERLFSVPWRLALMWIVGVLALVTVIVLAQYKLSLSWGNESGGLLLEPATTFAK